MTRVGENYVRRPESFDALSPYEREILDLAYHHANANDAGTLTAVLRTAYAAAMRDARENLSAEFDEAYERGVQRGMEMAGFNG